ncbi:rCG54680, partial [Rattus norvegicus]
MFYIRKQLWAAWARTSLIDTQSNLRAKKPRL